MDNQNIYGNVNNANNQTVTGEFTGQDVNFNQAGYQDPLAAKPVKQKKKASLDVTIASIVSVISVFLFGVLGAAIIYGVFWIARSIILSKKLPVVAKVILATLVIGGGIVLLFMMIFAVALLKS